MKALFNYSTPFMLAHGGMQTQIEQTMAGLRDNEVEVEPVRWWDASQSGQILHYFGRISTAHIHFAHQKGMKVVLADLLTGQGSRSAGRLRAQRMVMELMRTFLPGGAIAAFNWDSYRLADACVAAPLEARLLADLFGVPRARIHVLLNGAEEVFLKSQPAPRGKWLVCTATITERKRTLELAQAATLARTPVWIIGKPYSETDPYAKSFLSFAAGHSEFVRYDGPVPDRSRLAAIYREARGFVLLSTMESLSLSAGEAAACECPLLLSDLPWARAAFGEAVTYCPIAPVEQTAGHLKRFYEAAPALKGPGQPPSWPEVGRQLKGIYESLLKTSR
jgi:glycosyltransferase involved in cell wall biosynthesis